jgi:hypothetical protein
MSQKGQEKHKHVPNTLTHKMYPNISAFITRPLQNTFRAFKNFSFAAFFPRKTAIFDESSRFLQRRAPRREGKTNAMSACARARDTRASVPGEN